MNYIQDLQSYIESIPYGGVVLKIDRVNRKTVRIVTTGEETLRYTNNKEAVEDLGQMINKLIATGFSGEANVKLTMKDGAITLMSIFDKKETNYNKE